MEEQAIIAGCKVKNRICQKAFVDTYAPYLMGVCRRYINDNGLIKDCLQESLIKILSKIDQYQEKGQFKPWIAKIAVNECLQFIRRNKKHKFYDLTEIQAPIVGETSSYKLEKDDVMKFLDTLPERYKLAINMYIIEGYSHKEIGLMLGITESSSRSLVTRGRQKINKMFEIDQMIVIHRTENNKNNVSIK